MRFKLKEYPIDKLIIKSWFAWLPVRIDWEVRWLEKVAVKGYYKKGSTTFSKYKFI
jgi:hypothetical protein